MRSVYIETTIPSAYYDGRPEPEMLARQRWTREWWDDERFGYRLFTSVAVLDELRQGSHPMQDEKRRLLEGVSLLDATDEVLEVVEV